MKPHLWTVLFLTLPAWAWAGESVVTQLDRQECRHTPPAQNTPEDAGSWSCAGHGGVDVWIAAGDMREFISFGPMAGHEPAAEQTFGAFNHLGDTLEWWLEEGRPVAVSVRFVTTDAQGEKAQRLVVYRVPPGPACPVGVLDARDATTRAKEEEIVKSAAKSFCLELDEANDR